MKFREINLEKRVFLDFLTWQLNSTLDLTNFTCGDRVLAHHSRLTGSFAAAELDFIINYDIKYRMGREAGDNE
jgi:hypothetical protein